MMQMTMRQVWGVAIAEMRLQWRRRAMLVILLSFSGMMLLMTLLQRRSLVAEGMLNLPLDVATITVLFGVGPVGMLVMLLTLPAVVAETVPKDRQFGMAELLAAAPLPTGAYLAGKLLGVWLSVVGLLLGIALFQWLAGRLAFGPIDTGAYVAVWLQGILPLSLYASAMSLLLASRQPNRRRATLFGGVLTMVCILFFPFMTSDYGWPAAFAPSAWIQVMFRLLVAHLGDSLGQLQPGSVLPAVPAAFVTRTLVAAALQVGVVGIGVYAWWRVVERE